eukprot:TRINITY_DN16741_c0_g1_i1.p1 TRINITY_DN16741_c0_g1~~TRINITY_DN16741_c0_g1_i1.p1  ORF type:complete len:459 (+),score=92.42 TRINITY_DN16741_c0_g1_i1:99-1379(+)
MSFRELRSFKETMLALGYPRIISMENFRTPNFELVADCLYWLVQRYDPAADIVDEISTESDRIFFLQAVARTMYLKTRIKLNIKRLYAADGMAVKELLKIASLLHKATSKAKQPIEGDGDSSDTVISGNNIDSKQIRQLVSDIIKSAATMFDELSNEKENRDYRMRALQYNIDTAQIEQKLQEIIAQVTERVGQRESDLDKLQRQERAIDAKIDKKKKELEQNQSRLQNLQRVRPAYMDELERLQTDLQNMYVVYLEKARNLEYLEGQLEQHYKQEQEVADESEKKLKRIQRKLVEEELRILRGEQEVDETKLNTELKTDSEDSTPPSSPDNSSQRPVSMINVTKPGILGSGGGGKMVGALTGITEDSEDEVDDDDSDTDDTHVSMGASGGIGGDTFGSFAAEDEEFSDLGDEEDDEADSDDDNNF